MSAFDTIELDILMRKALNPRPPISAAEYKRRSRAKAKARHDESGHLVFNAENLSRALLDAIAALIQSSNLNEPVSTLIDLAAHQFPIPAVAAISIRQRLMKRKPTQLVS